MEIFTVLDSEWARLVRDPQAQRSAARWPATHPALAGGLGAVLERRRDPHQAGEVLLALARLAPGDGLAARACCKPCFSGWCD